MVRYDVAMCDKAPRWELWNSGDLDSLEFQVVAGDGLDRMSNVAILPSNDHGSCKAQRGSSVIYNLPNALPLACRICHIHPTHAGSRGSMVAAMNICI